MHDLQVDIDGFHLSDKFPARTALQNVFILLKVLVWLMLKVWPGRRPLYFMSKWWKVLWRYFVSFSVVNNFPFLGYCQQTTTTTTKLYYDTRDKFITKFFHPHIARRIVFPRFLMFLLRWCLNPQNLFICLQDSERNYSTNNDPKRKT